MKFYLFTITILSLITLVILLGNRKAIWGKNED